MKLMKWLLLVIIILYSDSYALPRFSLRQNDKCSSCHYDPTGGGMRNENGVFFGKNVISMISPRDEDFKISPKLSDNVSFGLDIRSQYLYSMEKKRSDFQDMSGSVYANVDLSEKINVTARYDFSAYIWEAFAVARILPNDSYIKVGTFLPNYGIRLDDHTAYTRGGDLGLLFSTGRIQGMIYNPYYNETGIEAGINISDFGLVTASVGKSVNNSVLTTDPTFTTSLQLYQSLGRLRFFGGGSFASFKTRSGASRLNSTLAGGFAGLGYKRITVMGEFDAASDYLGAGVKTNALMIEAAYQFMLGLEGVVRYDRFDPNTSAVDDEVAHLIVGLEFYPYSFVEIRPQYRFMLEKPAKDNDSFVVQFHFWF